MKADSDSHALSRERSFPFTMRSVLINPESGRSALPRQDSSFFSTLFFVSIFFCIVSCTTIPINPSHRPEKSAFTGLTGVEKEIKQNNLIKALYLIEDLRNQTVVSENALQPNSQLNQVFNNYFQQRGISLTASAKSTIKRSLTSAIKASPPGTSELDIVNFQRFLTGDTAAVVYAILDNSYSAILITDHTIEYYRLTISKQAINKEIEDVQSLLLTPAGKDLLNFRLHLLYLHLFEPFENRLADKKNIILIPTSSLQFLPFQCFVKKIDAGTSTPCYLIEDFNFIYANSLSSVYRGTHSQVHPFSMLIFGDPYHSDLSAMFGRLPYAMKEARLVHTILPESTFLRANQASETRLKETIADHSVIHLATHGFIFPEMPYASFLLTGDDAANDGMLTLDEIQGLKLSADLVVLSACETASVIGSPPDNNTAASLSNAFIQAGADAVISSLWPVSDEATSELMGEFYLKFGVTSISENLRSSQLRLLRSNDYNHPYFWAPFILYGKYY